MHLFNHQSSIVSKIQELNSFKFNFHKQSELVIYTLDDCSINFKQNLLIDIYAFLIRLIFF